MIFTTALISAFWITGAYRVTRRGEPLAFIGNLFGTARWQKPLLTCPHCMSSIHGGIIAMLAYPVDQWYLVPVNIIITYGIVSYVQNQWNE